MKVIIISLSDSKRRERIQDRLDKLGISDYEFFNAYDARDKSDEQLSKVFDINKFALRYKRKPAKGEIGCTLSHFYIWEKIAKSKSENWVILEDDAILSRCFIGLKKIEKFPDGITSIGFSKISYIKGFFLFFKYPLYNISLCKKFLCGEMKSHSFRGTVGYILNKNTAKKLSNIDDKYPCFLADDFDYIKNVVKTRVLRPLLVYEDFKNLPSSIQKERMKLNSEIID
ncbi:TPA: glycosyltransferase family 25 protein [Photobacterium damselae]